MGKPYIAQPYLAVVILFCVSWYTYDLPALAVLYGIFWVLNMSRPRHVCKNLDVGYGLLVKSLFRVRHGVGLRYFQSDFGCSDIRLSSISFITRGYRTECSPTHFVTSVPNSLFAYCPKLLKLMYLFTTKLRYSILQKSDAAVRVPKYSEERMRKSDVPLINSANRHTECIWLRTCTKSTSPSPLN